MTTAGHPTGPTDSTGSQWSAIVLAGGTSRRWGGRDKTAVRLSGRSVLGHAAAAALPEAVALVVVAPTDHPARGEIDAIAAAAGRPVSWTLEHPPGGGPVAGLAAGVAGLPIGLAGPAAGAPVQGTGMGSGTEPAGQPAGQVVVVLAGDLPFARTALARLLAALDAEPADAAIGIDPSGRRQPLLAAYRVPALRPRLSGQVAGQPLRQVLAGLRVVDVPVSAEEAFDLDTPEALATAESILHENSNPPLVDSRHSVPQQSSMLYGT
jgi:molybdenum cofactor guanylyltransferase